MGLVMEYNGIELCNYPICDTDIWVDVVLAKIVDKLFEKYEKVIVSDVVEKEILYFESGDYAIVADTYCKYKNDGKVVVICHTDIDINDRKLLERQLKDCSSEFQYGLADKPHEEHKGEIVSAIYACHFEIPFLKSNDGTFREGHMGRIAFPDLIVKNRRQTLIDLLKNENDRISANQLIEDNRAFMNEGKRLYENREVTKDQVMNLLEKMRGNCCR